MEPFVSVIIPIYNEKNQLKTCLESVFQTSYKNFEVIIVDDASSDDPHSLLAPFACTYIRIPTNKGPAYARNRGAEKAHGEILLFTDADCRVMPDWVRIASQQLQQARLSQKTFAALTGRLPSHHDFIASVHTYACYGYVQESPFRTMEYLNTACAAVYTDSFWKVGGFSEDLRVGEDPDLALKLIEHGYTVLFDPSVWVFHDHQVHTFTQFITKQRQWGNTLALHLEIRHPQRVKNLLPLLVNPFFHFFLLVPLALLSTLRIIMCNIKSHKKILLYAPFILWGKILFRWSIFKAYFKKLKIDHETWKQKDRQYHEDPAVVASYDARVTKYYAVEHSYFTIAPWIALLKKEPDPLVLDFGCGTGAVTLKLLQAGIRTVSVDASCTMLATLKAKAASRGLSCTCVQADGEHLPFPDAHFDAVICAGVLHHMPDIAKGISEQLRVLKKNGCFFITEPYKEKPWFSFCYHLPVAIATWIVHRIRRRSLNPQERAFSHKDAHILFKILNQQKCIYSVHYLVYWPFVCALLPHKIAFFFTQFLNIIKGRAPRGDSLILQGRK